MPDEEEHLSPEQKVKELADIKAKVYLPGSYGKSRRQAPSPDKSSSDNHIRHPRYSELVLYELNNETGDDVTQAFYAVLEAASKNVVNEGKQVKDGFDVMPTKKLFVTTYHATVSHRSLLIHVKTMCMGTPRRMHRVRAVHLHVCCVAETLQRRRPKKEDPKVGVRRCESAVSEKVPHKSSGGVR